MGYAYYVSIGFDEPENKDINIDSIFYNLSHEHDKS